MQMETLKGYYMGMIWLQIAATIIALTGIFPFAISILGVDYSSTVAGVTSDFDALRSGISSGTLSLEYFSLIGSFMVYGLKFILGPFIMVFFGIGDTMASVGLDRTVATLIQGGIDAGLLYELGQTLLR